jgi:hypothetical protein
MLTPLPRPLPCPRSGGLSLLQAAEAVERVHFYLAYHGYGDDRRLQELVARLHLAASPDLAYLAPHCRRAMGEPGGGGPMQIDACV